MSDETRPNSMATGSVASGVPVGTAGALSVAGAPVITESSNPTAAILGGFAAAVLGAVAWAVITVATKYQIGFMAVGVGFLVGWAVRTLGKGHTQVFGIIGGGFALLGCILGNLLSACGFIAADRGVSVASVAVKVLATPAVAANILQATFNGMDLLFYAIAVYEGYKLALRRRA